MMKNGATRITVSLTPGIYTGIAEIARASGVSVSWVMRYAAECLIAERQSGQLQQLLLPIEREIRMGGTR